VGAASFGAFSSMYNYMPFHLAGPPFLLPTHLITMLYLSYLVGVAIGPLAGRLGNRVGNGIAMAIGGAVFGASARPHAGPVPRGHRRVAGGRVAPVFSSCIPPRWER